LTVEEGNIFGTDGIRDAGGRGWLAPPGLAKLGAALVAHARRLGRASPSFVIARDPRESGPAIEDALVAALERHGATVARAGILPTPAVSLLVAEGAADLGIVISASHNPPEFNGVKLFAPDGAKPSVEDEERISADARAAPPAEGGERPRGEGDRSLEAVLRERYVVALLREHDRTLAGLSIVLDCACGATSVVARDVFRRAGARARAIHGAPDGARINVDCGSTHPRAVAREVVAAQADHGIAFDGDGDRAILVDERGHVVDGDEMLALWALDLERKGELAGGRIVATVMSNAGMERFLADRGIGVVRTPVGDREVARAMRAGGYALGGEQSGHIIQGAMPTGDGIRTGLALARLVAESRQPLSELRAPIPRYPQTLLGVAVTAKPSFDTLPEVGAAVEAAERALAGRGRVLLRYSGTEPLARVLVEGEDARENAHLAEAIAAVLRAHPACQLRRA
jgi:phosphoglucosamine mutase